MHGMNKWLLGIFYTLFLIVPALDAKLINILDEPQLLLTDSSCYYDQEGLSFSEVKTKQFTPSVEAYINRSFDAETTVWVQLDLQNPSDMPMERVLEITNPLLPDITLYDGEEQKKMGILYKDAGYRHINPSFVLTFKPHEHRIVWLKVRNKTTMLEFGLLLEPKPLFEHQDLMQQMQITLFLGMIFALWAFALLLYLYMRDSSYFFYALYLFALMFHQMTYVGLTPLYAPLWFNRIDDLIVVPKVVFLIIAAAWYAMIFLRTERFRVIHRVYWGFIIWLLVMIPVTGTQWFYVPEVSIVTGLLFVFFNTFVGIYIYLKGYKQARFFVLGWLVLIFAYILMIIDALGAISVMHTIPNLLMWASTIEATLLLLAFVDRYSVLEGEKEQLNEELVLEYNMRQNIIENEVKEKTMELSTALTQKELLFKELHHRVKNNLQLVMSLLRLQHDHSSYDEENGMLEQLEGRIGAIARTHELLYQRSGDEMVNMQEYVDDYVEGMEASLDDVNITLTSDIDARLPLSEAVYVGLIINELVSNALKHAYGADGGGVHIQLTANGDVYLLEVSDEGRGYNNQDIDEKSLGLTLVKTLVEEQLEGTLLLDSTKGTHYTMRFVV